MPTDAELKDIEVTITLLDHCTTHGQGEVIDE